MPAISLTDARFGGARHWLVLRSVLAKRQLFVLGVAKKHRCIGPEGGAATSDFWCSSESAGRCAAFEPSATDALGAALSRLTTRHGADSGV
jgi:hypothetical protein